MTDRWREAVLADVRGQDVSAATRALLDLTYHEPDRRLLESILVECSAEPYDRQVRRLALTCMGHVARIHGALSSDVVGLLHGLLGDPVFGGTAEDTLDDFASFVGGAE